MRILLEKAPVTPKLVVIGEHEGLEVRCRKLWREDLGPSEYNGRPEYLMFTDQHHLGVFNSIKRCKRELWKLNDNDNETTEDARYERNLTGHELSWGSFSDKETKKWKIQLQNPNSAAFKESFNDDSPVPSGTLKTSDKQVAAIKLPNIFFTKDQ